MEEFIATETLIIELILVATLVAIAARRIRLPYTVALVLVGLSLSIWIPLDIEMTPELILALFVPPLIFEAAFHLDLRLLRANLIPILLLAVPGVLLTMFIVGGIVTVGTDLPFAVAIVFGALIAATDPVAVVALFRELGVPRGLSVALEGESLFNDGTAIVVFGIAVDVALSGTFDINAGLANFARVSFGGLAVGLALGWITAQLMARLDDQLISTTLTTLLAYSAYLTAERLHVSGVLAVVAAGLLTGNMGVTSTSPSVKNMIFNLWEYLAFMANSLIFLLIGMEVELLRLWENLWPIVVAVVAVLMGRAVVVYGLSWLIWLVKRQRPLPFRWQHVLFWGGLRGAIALALALSLPIALPHRETLLAMAFGVLLFTLMGQGTSLQFMLKRLGLIERPEHIVQQERYLGRLLATQRGQRRLEELYRDGILMEEMWKGLSSDYMRSRAALEEELNDLFAGHAELERELLLQMRKETLRAERSALIDALRRGMISEDIFEELRTDIDRRLEALEVIQVSIRRRQEE